MTRDTAYAPLVACDVSVAWEGSEWWGRKAERHEDREVDCMACIAAGLEPRASYRHTVSHNPCAEIELRVSGLLGDGPGEPGFLAFPETDTQDPE